MYNISQKSDAPNTILSFGGQTMWLSFAEGVRDLS